MAERNSSSLQDEVLSKVVKEIVRCTNFAALKHKDQRRKDKQQTPYVNHVIGEAKRHCKVVIEKYIFLLHDSQSYD